MLEGKAFQHRVELARAMEQTFLERYFGSDRRILDFARELIQLGARDAINALNKLVDVRGSNVEAVLVIDRVSRDYRIAARTNFVKQRLREEEDGEQQREQALVDQSILMSSPTLPVAKRLAEFFGYEVTEMGAGLFRDPECPRFQRGPSPLSQPSPVDPIGRCGRSVAAAPAQA